MKRLLIVVAFCTSSLFADTQGNTQLGSGSADSAFSGVSLSMAVWGLSLAGAIALLAGAISQSTGSAHSHSN